MLREEFVMATNPMQRKARNSFLLGMLIMLVITGIIIAFLFLQLMNKMKAEQELKASYVSVYVLNRNIKSGEEVTSSDFKQVEVVKSSSPTDYLSTADLGDKNVAKIALTSGTILSKEMIYVDETATGNDIRKQEYNVVLLPTQLTTGDYIDIRLALPSGADYIVVSKKKVEIPVIAGVDSLDTIWVELAEEEILSMNNAIVDAYRLKGAKLYATTYTEPGIQEAASPTFPVNSEVLAQINGDPNILKEAREGLLTRYNATDAYGEKTQVNQRVNVIDNAINQAGDQGKSNLETKIEESIVNSKTTRKEYWDSLSGANY
jgi:type II secretory pathway pseudopilin PulG